MERSSLNATHHSLLARCVVLTNESRKGFDILLAQRLERFGPVDGVELGVIGEMAATLGRLTAAFTGFAALKTSTSASLSEDPDITKRTYQVIENK